MLGKGGIWRRRLGEIPLPILPAIYVGLILFLFVALLPHIGVTLMAFAYDWPVGSILPSG